MEAGLGDPKDGGYTRYEKDDCRPSEAQELLRHKFMGYVLSVTGHHRSPPVTAILHELGLITNVLRPDAEIGRAHV